jgi:hypothetical protein
MILQKLCIILLISLLPSCGAFSALGNYLSKRTIPGKSKDIVVALSFAALFRKDQQVKDPIVQPPDPPNIPVQPPDPPSNTEPNDPWKYPAKLRVLSTGDGSLLVSWGTWCNNTEDDDIKERTENDSCLPANAYFTVEFCDDNKSTTTNCRPVPIEQPKENSTQVLECTTKEYNEAAPDPCFKTRYSHAVISKDADHKPLIQTDTVNGIQGANAVKFIKIKAHQGEKFRYVPISGNIGYFNNTIVDTPNQDLEKPAPAPGKISFNKQQYIYGLSKIDYLKSSEMISVFLVIGTRTYDQIIQRTRIDFLLNEKKVRYTSGTIQMELDNGSSQLMMKGVLSWAKVALLIAQMDQGQVSEFYKDLDLAINAVNTGNPMHSFKTYSTSIFPTDAGKLPSYTHSVELPLRSESYPFGKKDKGYQGISPIAPDIVKTVYDNDFLVPNNATVGSIVDLEARVDNRHLFSILSYMSMDSEGYDFVKDRTGMFICFDENKCVQDIGNTSSTSGSAGIYFHPLSKLDRTENSAVVGILFSVISSFVVNTVIPQIVNAAVNAVKDWAIKEVMKNIPILKDIQRITQQISQALDFVDQVRNLKIPDIKMPDIGNVNISFNPSIPMPSLEIPNIGIGFQNPLEQVNLNLQPNFSFDPSFQVGLVERSDLSIADDFGLKYLIPEQNSCFLTKAEVAGKTDCKNVWEEIGTGIKNTVGFFMGYCLNEEACIKDFHEKYCATNWKIWRNSEDGININSVKNNSNYNWPIKSSDYKVKIDTSPFFPADLELLGDSNFHKIVDSNYAIQSTTLNSFNNFYPPTSSFATFPLPELLNITTYWDAASEADSICDKGVPKMLFGNYRKSLFDDDKICYNGKDFRCTDDAFKIKPREFIHQLIHSEKAKLFSISYGRLIYLDANLIKTFAKFCYDLQSTSNLKCLLTPENSNYRDIGYNRSLNNSSYASRHVLGIALDFEIVSQSNLTDLYKGNLLGTCTWNETSKKWDCSNKYNSAFYKLFKTIYDSRKRIGDDFTLMIESQAWHISLTNKEGPDPWSGKNPDENGKGGNCNYSFSPEQVSVCRDFKKCVDKDYEDLETCLANQSDLDYYNNNVGGNSHPNNQPLINKFGT